MRSVLIRRDSGDLKNSASGTRAVIHEIQNKYLNQYEKNQISAQLMYIIPRKKYGQIRNIGKYVTEHLKLTCAFVTDKFPIVH